MHPHAHIKESLSVTILDTIAINAIDSFYHSARGLTGGQGCYGAATVQIQAIYEYSLLIVVSAFLFAYDKNFIQQAEQY